MPKSFKTLGVALARAASDKKADDIQLLHAASSPITDYMLIVTANSRPHLEALEDAVEKAAKELGQRPLRRARPRSDQWRVSDFGGLIVHFMTAEARQHYALERLYEDAKPVAWEEKSRKKDA